MLGSSIVKPIIFYFELSSSKSSKFSPAAFAPVRRIREVLFSLIYLFFSEGYKNTVESPFNKLSFNEVFYITKFSTEP